MSGGPANRPGGEDDDDGALPWLIEESPLAIIEWTPDRRVRRWNRAATEIFGYEAEEMAGTAGERLVPDDAEGRFDDHWDRLVRDEGAKNVVVENLRADGSTVTCEWYNTLLREDGRITGALSIVRDVTEQRRRTRAIETLHEATRNLMEARTPEEIGEVGVRTAREVLDMPYTTFFRHEQEAGLLRPTVYSEGFLEEFDEAPAFEVGEGITGGAFETGEIEIHDNGQEDPRAHPDGPERIRGFAVFPLGEYGVINASSPEVGAFDERDVALARILAANMEAALARAERERQLARQNERLDEFASFVSHDLRTPLSTASANLELARETGDSERFDAAQDALERMEDLIDGMLTMAREGDLVEETREIDLAAFARETFAALDTPETTLRCVDPGTARADPERLRAVFENLLRNAVEHASASADSRDPDDPVETTVTVGRLPDRDGFYVADDGPGVPEERRDRIFERGYSGAGGTGLGLAIVEDIVEAHQWSIDVTDADGGGARFEIETRPTAIR